MAKGILPPEPAAETSCRRSGDRSWSRPSPSTCTMCISPPLEHRQPDPLSSWWAMRKRRCRPVSPHASAHQQHPPSAHTSIEEAKANMEKRRSIPEQSQQHIVDLLKEAHHDGWRRRAGASDTGALPTQRIQGRRREVSRGEGRS